MSDTIIEDQFNFDTCDFSDYYVVKIAGKGNINKEDVRNVYLSSYIYESVEKIKDFINNNNINNKKVAIAWDGDNYQNQDHKMPSPFTDLIFELSKVENYSMFALKYKKDNTNPWKQKHVDSWAKMVFTKLYNNQEPHIINNHLCNMYVSYGSTNFKHKNDDVTQDLTSGYYQLQEFNKNYNLNTVYNNNTLGFEIYTKN